MGRAGILHHDFPKQVEKDKDFVMHSLPVSREYLGKEGLSDAFIKYMSGWDGFVAD